MSPVLEEAFVKGAIVYFGKWGHLRQVSEMIIKGLLEEGHEVALLESGVRLPEGMEFVVLGAPTRLGKLPSEIKRFVKRDIGDAQKGMPFAVFSTGDAKMIGKGEKQACDVLYDLLLSKGLLPITFAFKVGAESMKGKLADGALITSYYFGRQVGEMLHAGEMEPASE